MCSRTAAFAYHRTPDGWILEQRIAFPEGRLESALDGNRLLLVHRGGNAKLEEASLWERFPGNPPWRKVADLVPQTQDSTARLTLGQVALSGDVALIGAKRRLQDGSLELPILVFRKDAASGSWRQEAELPLVPGDSGAHVKSIAADDDLAVVAVYDQFEKKPVHVYRYDNDAAAWHKEAELRLPAVADDPIGNTFSMACDDGVIVVSAGWHSVGEACVYRHDPASGAWRLEARLSELLLEPARNLGWWVAIDDERISATAYSEWGAHSDEWHLFEFDHQLARWTYSGAIREQDSGLLDFRKGRHALSGNTLIVGAPQHDGAGIDAGAAYIFDLASALHEPGTTGKEAVKEP